MPTSPSPFRSRLEFKNAESWRAYIETDVPSQDRGYITAFGMTTLYLQFYAVRNLAVPLEVDVELHRLQAFDEPARTRALVTLNNRIFADMTRLMMQAAPAEPAAITAESPKLVMERLILRLEKESPAFAIWRSYKRARLSDSHVPEWSEYVCTLVPREENEEAEFILLMGQLGELLRQVQEQDKTVDSLLKIRLFAIGRERAGAERNLAARLLVQDLLEAIAPCACA
ncbi:hypothetical protein ACFPT7_07080 [Acidicapsa dinghuensis]|uniref:Uncharacterized protein n=1 Tax=Acidicapsa dinghuensis TaxID=2218256 RepID=A0ABW1EDH8_9BACT|nr:hypothetical protein [Acidicapsa dinghuensis]